MSPVYPYKCPKCGEFEHVQSIHDDKLIVCPKCKSKVERLISTRSSFSISGGGVYNPGFRGPEEGEPKPKPGRIRIKPEDIEGD